MIRRPTRRKRPRGNSPPWSASSWPASTGPNRSSWTAETATSSGTGSGREPVQELGDFLDRLAAHMKHPGAHVDPVVKNLARLFKAPGGYARKGPGTKERPHRRSKQLSAPNPATVAPLSAEAFAATLAVLPEVVKHKAVGTGGKPARASVAATLGEGTTRYGRAALDAETARLADAPEGSRNDTLNKSAYAVGQLVAGGEIQEAEAVGRLTAAATQAGLVPSEITKTIGSAMAAGMKSPRKPQPKVTPERRVVASPSTDPNSLSASPDGDTRPTIQQQPAQLDDVVDRAVRAVARANTPPTVFSFGNALVRLQPDDPDKPILDLPIPRLSYLLSKVARWVSEKQTKHGSVMEDVFPKEAVVRSVQTQHRWPGIPALKGITDVPVLTRESGLLTRPGFDPASGLYLLPSDSSQVPEVSPRPTAEEVARAKTLLFDELLGDFPFEDSGSRAAGAALYVLPFVRGLIDGPTPLRLVNAPTEGTGKSLFAETWGHVAFGRDLEAIPEADHAAEWRKTILAAAIEAPRVLFLDNVTALDAGPLAIALTGPTVGGRLLGHTKMVSAPVRFVWLATGNKPRVSKEIIRRTVLIRLDANRATTWQGRKFRHLLPAWAEENRGQLVWACLTLCQAWAAAGMPAGTADLGKYERWAAVVSGVLEFNGIPGLLSNAAKLRETAGEAGDEWRPFVLA